MIRILHSSDLHLGKPFGRFTGDVPARLRAARADVVSRLAALARDQGAAAILLAGDTFDTETPSPQVIRHAMNAMRDDTGLRWIILPGNHDSLFAAELWRTLAAGAPDNVTLAIDTGPIALDDHAVVLPAPCTHRRPGLDLTDSLSQPTPPGVIRVGLAHGAVTDFGGTSSEDGNPAIIPPDRAARSGLDYLALGDWHGQMSIGPRQWYSGTPERDGFKHAGRGAALLITLPGPGAMPEVTGLETGTFAWDQPVLDLHPGDDAAERLSALLPPLAMRRDQLIQFRPTGRLLLSAQAALVQAFAAVAPDFLFFDADLSQVETEQDSSDLDLIDRAGALRAAADQLAAEAADPTRSSAERDISAAALSHLFAFATETA